MGAESAEREPAPKPPTRRRTLLQRKLVVGPADDGFEQEADRVANAVMRELATGLAPEQSDLLANAGATRIQPRRSPDAIGVDGGEVDSATASAIGVAAGRGAALDPTLRRKLEHGFGADFSAVRVHTDARADAISDQLQAHAFTAGRDVFFSDGAYAPSTPSGQRVLAHELVHVIQQGHAPVVNRSASIPRAVHTETPEVTHTGTGDGRSTIRLQVSSDDIGAGATGGVEDRYTHFKAPATKLLGSTRIQAATSSAGVVAAPPIRRAGGRIRRTDDGVQRSPRVGNPVESSLASGQPNAIGSGNRIRRSTYATNGLVDATPSSRVMQRKADSIVRRKFKDLPEKGLKQEAKERIGEKTQKSLQGYNSTPAWEMLGGTALEEQLDDDQKKLKYIEALLGDEDLYRDGDNEDEEKLRIKFVQEVIDEAGQHTKALVTWRKEAAAAAEEAKPLKDKYHVGLKADIEEYQKLVGDAEGLEDVSDESVAAIVKLYKPGTGDAWTAELNLRNLEKKNLTGDGGWIADALREHIRLPQVVNALHLIGNAKRPDQLSQDTMIRIIAELKAANVANDVSQYFGRQVDKRAAGESSASVKAEAEAIRATRDTMVRNALSLLGKGETWAELSTDIDRWWKALEITAKKDEATFNAPYMNRQMTVRAVAKNSAAQGGMFKASIMKGESKTTTGDADMSLERDRESILKRTNPENWSGETSDLAAKQKTGLYELSASLLDPSRKDILSQMKFYKAPEAVVFAPAAHPLDQQIFAAISTLADADQPTLRKISSKMTRIIMAQSTDMGTKYVDFSPGNTGTDIRYGESGTLIRHAAGTGKAARSHELEERRLNALMYWRILKDSKQLVNEVVVEYRQHASGLFPLFAKVDHNQKRFYILKKSNFEPTKAYIDNEGTVHDA